MHRFRFGHDIIRILYSWNFEGIMLLALMDDLPKARDLKKEGLMGSLIVPMLGASSVVISLMVGFRGR